jgi:hypothetical protein
MQVKHRLPGGFPHIHANVVTPENGRGSPDSRYMVVILGMSPTNSGMSTVEFNKHPPRPDH